jgi:hypothetical protein
MAWGCSHGLARSHWLVFAVQASEPVALGPGADASTSTDHGAEGCASAPKDSLGILTEAILASERDSGAIGQQNAITAGNSASRPWRIR